MQRSSIGRGVTGAAAGFVLAYAAVRLVQAALDVRAPVAAIDRPNPERYGREQRRLRLAGMARGLADSAVVAFVAGDPLERALRGLPRPLRAISFALTIATFDALRDIGIAYVEDHRMERVYGMSKQSARAWLLDRIKATAIGAAIVAVLTGLADAAISSVPRRWPFVAIAAMPVLLTLGTIFAPNFILPLFNTYEPLTGPLEARIRELAARHGVGDAAILRFNMSLQTAKANAFVTGVLGSERIVLADTLIDAFADDETLFVVAHELGHYVRRDPWLLIAFGTIVTAVTLLPADAILRRATGRGVTSAAQGARLAFYIGLIELVLGPFEKALSRAIESRADRFATEATRDPAAGARAFRRLGTQNLAELDPPRWSELLFASHPSLASRIRALEALA